MLAPASATALGAAEAAVLPWSPTLMVASIAGAVAVMFGALSGGSLGPMHSVEARRLTQTEKINTEPSSMSKDEMPDDEQEEQAFVMPTEKHWEWMEAKVEARMSALQAMTVVTTLIAGFAISDVRNFAPSSWSSDFYFMELYVFCLTAVIGINLYVSVVGVMTLVTVRRLSSWDVRFKIQELSAMEVFNHKDYQTAMKLIFGSDMTKWTVKPHKMELKEGISENTRMVRAPLQYTFEHFMCDGLWSFVGFGIAMFPWSLELYLISVILFFTKKASPFINALVCSMLLPLAIFVMYILRFLTALFHA